MKSTSLDTYSETWPEEEKAAKKAAAIQSIVQSADTISFYDAARFEELLSSDFAPNNTYFMGFKRYRADLGVFETEFREQYNSDFAAYVTHLKEKYG